VGVRTRLLTLLAGLALAGCPSDPLPPGTGGRPEIIAVDGPTTAVEGSLLRVTGIAFDDLAEGAALRVSSPSGQASLPEDTGEEADSGERWFTVTRELVDALGSGTHDAQAVITDGTLSSPSHTFGLTLATALPIALDAPPGGEVHRNDLAVLTGAGFLAPGEGTVDARFRGSFTPDEGGGSTAVDALLPVHPAERFSRDRGVVRLTTALGGMWPGTFDGTMQLEQRLRGGGTDSTGEAPVTLRFLPPELFAVEPTMPALEQIVTVRGAGFLGGDLEPDEQTLIRLEGTFQPLDASERGFGPAELVLAWVSGSEVRGVMAAEPSEGELVSMLFGSARGTFRGTAAPVVIDGTDELTGDAVPFELTLRGTEQVVYLKFLPGFYDSLTRFGLASAAGVVEQRVADRIEGIYDDWRVDVRLERPEDFSPNGWALLEVGGPDPNGVGLFGYDNTPGKDVGNLRLYDAIGGANAETQEDGYPGYGGVFVESFLYFSSHPDLPGELPVGIPEPDPLFDEIFDPVRGNPATLEEVRGEGGRVGVVQRAVHALASIIGETAAHELGHSLGLADPYGPPTTFHNGSDDPGCLMDSGGARPFGERADEAGFAPTQLCHEAPRYLDAILGR